MKHFLLKFLLYILCEIKLNLIKAEKYSKSVFELIKNLFHDAKKFISRCQKIYLDPLLD